MVVSQDFLTELYHGEYPPQEEKYIHEIVRNNGADYLEQAVVFADIKEAVLTLRKRSDDQVYNSTYYAGSGSEFTSNKQFREHRFKHSRLRADPVAKYSEPVITSQAVHASFDKPH